MVCPVCGAPLDDDAKECFICGYKITEENDEEKEEEASQIPSQEEGKDEEVYTCPNCGFILSADDTVCPFCGAQIDNAQPRSGSTVNESTSDSDNGQGTGTFEEENNTPKPKSRKNQTIAIIVVIILLIVAGVAAFFIVRNIRGNDETEDTDKEIEVEEELQEEEIEEPVQEEESVEEDSAVNIKPDSSYLGYWNIKGDENTELAITNISDSTVEFSICWYRLYEINDATARFDDENVATFSNNTDGFLISGTLTFYKGMISVKITGSNVDTIGTGTMIFDQQHSPAWYYGTVSDYTANAGLGTDDFYGDYGENYKYYDYNYELGSDDGFILPESDYELLTYSDIANLSSEELRLARNEIYARHGRRFDDASLQAYFDSCWWYEGTIDPEDFSDDVLNDIEKENIKFIKSYE